MNDPGSTTPASLSVQSQLLLKELRTSPQFQALLVEWRQKERMEPPRYNPFRKESPDKLFSDFAYYSGKLDGIEALMVFLTGHDTSKRQSDG